MNSTERKASAYTQLLMLYILLLTGLIAFTGISYVVLAEPEPMFFKDSQRDILLTALAIATICMSVSSFLWKKDIQSIQSMDTIEQKFKKYRSAMIKRVALMEGAALFALICYYLTSNIRLLAIAILIIIAFIFLWPRLSRMSRDIGEDEQSIKDLQA
jgi:DMSO reductase anchor subunit